MTRAPLLRDPFVRPLESQSQAPGAVCSPGPCPETNQAQQLASISPQSGSKRAETQTKQNNVTHSNSALPLHMPSLPSAPPPAACAASNLPASLLVRRIRTRHSRPRQSGTAGHLRRRLRHTAPPQAEKEALEQEGHKLDSLSLDSGQPKTAKPVNAKGGSVLPEQPG